MPSKRLLVEENIKKQIPFRFLPILEKKKLNSVFKCREKKERKKERTGSNGKQIFRRCFDNLFWRLIRFPQIAFCGVQLKSIRKSQVKEKKPKQRNV